MFYDLIAATSIGMTIPALILCVWVMVRYHGTFQCITKECIKFRRFVAISPTDWIGLGIFIGFLGELVDGLYWFVTWITIYYDIPVSSTLERWGVIANLPSRQWAIILAAYGHIRASYMVQPSFESEKFNRIMGLLVVAGLVASTVFFLLH